MRHRFSVLHVDSVPHREQRYDTVGDYYQKGDDAIVNFTISQMRDWRSEAAVFLHEFIEAMLCQQAGITLEQIDTWDFCCAAQGIEDPGAAKGCPYRFEHQSAEMFEKHFVQLLGLSWNEHERNCTNASCESGPERSAGEIGCFRGAGAGVPALTGGRLPGEAGRGGSCCGPGATEDSLGL